MRTLEKNKTKKSGYSFYQKTAGLAGHMKSDQ